jgi:Protein of unknown function (DUF2591)
MADERSKTTHAGGVVLLKTSELTGLTLNFAVALALGNKPTIITREQIIANDPEMDEDEKAFHRLTSRARIYIVVSGENTAPCPAYATDWAKSGPIKERHNIRTQRTYSSGVPNTGADAFKADLDFLDGILTLGEFTQYGSTELEAALRCYATSKLGAEVEIPAQLLAPAATKPSQHADASAEEGGLDADSPSIQTSGG